MKTKWSRKYLEKKYGRNGARRFMVQQMFHAEKQTGQNWVFKRTSSHYILKRACDCGCSHAHDHGACDDFTGGANGRCVYCDHGQDCHPGPGPFCNGPLQPGHLNKTREDK